MIPIIHQGILYLNTNESIQARRSNDGSLLWRVRASGNTAFVVTNTTLFTSKGKNTMGEVSAFRTDNGSLIWRKHISSHQGGVTSPVAAHGAVYVGIGATGGLYAFSAKNGSILWKALEGMSVTTAARYNRPTLMSKASPAIFAIAESLW